MDFVAKVPNELSEEDSKQVVKSVNRRQLTGKHMPFTPLLLP